MGAVPYWYRVLKAAQYLGVEPWALESQPYYWLTRAEAAQDAEARVKRPKGEGPPA